MLVLLLYNIIMIIYKYLVNQFPRDGISEFLYQINPRRVGFLFF